jgi:hypothetical protein
METDLSYDFPMLLAGTTQKVQLSGNVDASGTTAQLTGPSGTATCAFASVSRPGHVRCTERLPGIVVDVTAVRALATTLDPLHVDARVAVAERFDSEPIGVVDVTVP